MHVMTLKASRISNSDITVAAADNPQICGYGASLTEAVGDLMLTHMEYFALQIAIAGAEDLENPYDHESSYNGCAADCQACAWEREHTP